MTVCARTMTLYGSWTTQNGQFKTKKRFHAERAVDVANGIGELSQARKQQKGHRDFLDERNKDFTNELQRRIDRDLGRPMVSLADDMGVTRAPSSMY